MKRLICLLFGILLACSLCACQQAAPSSSEAPDQQVIKEEATEYFNQMMDGDFETFFNALPQDVQDKTSVEAIQETWEEEADMLGGLLEDAIPDVSCYVPTIPRMAAFTTMSFGKMKQNKKERHLYE